ncbi:MAG: hypothetical protein JJ967_15800 [Muricauda sp.]|nr:hypothetical protein [Allomuricauda sp.]
MDYLFIDNGDDSVRIPKEFWLTHNLMVRNYDLIVSLLLDENIRNQMSVKVDFNDAPPEDIQDVDILDYLIENGYESSANIFIRNHLTSALVSDLCGFMHQSIMSIKRGYLTVGMQLLRKPLLENLLVLEKLNFDTKSFIEDFKEDPKFYDPGKISDPEKEKIIRYNLSESYTNLTFDIAYNFRFDKNRFNSIYTISNQATHLVTNRHLHKTEKMNMNFIFSENQARAAQLEYYYNLVGPFYGYMVDVIYQLFLKYDLITPNQKIKANGICLLRQLIQSESKINFSKIISPLGIKCIQCQNALSFSNDDILNLVEYCEVTCRKCNSRHSWDSDFLDPIYKLLLRGLKK